MRGGERTALPGPADREKRAAGEQHYLPDFPLSGTELHAAHINMVSYVTQLRINRAKELLAASEMKIRDIAQAVGFEDEKYFSRRFTKEVGMSPNEYRGKRAEEG